MSSVGIDARTGKLLVGWDHIVHCIGRTLMTELGSRAERRDLGSLVPRLQDKPQNEETLVNFYMAIAESLEPRRMHGQWYGEPRFALGQVRYKADVPGEVMVGLIGDEVPNGHKGDFSRTTPRTVTFAVNSLSDSVKLQLVR